MKSITYIIHMMVLSSVTCSLFSCEAKYESNVPTVSTSAYYTQWGKEAQRLATDEPGALLERLRTESIIERFAPKPPAIIYDIGGGAGIYAFPLAQRGYEVHLFDITPLHIQQAQEKMRTSRIRLAQIKVGDARNIEADDNVADIVLLLGPLYHLQDKSQRLQALKEAYRILKPGGILFAAAIPRYSLLLSMCNKNKLLEPYVSSLIEDVIKLGYGTTLRPGHSFYDSAYFHQPDELEAELVAAGFNNVRLLVIQWPLPLFSSLPEIVANKQALDKLLYFLQMIEGDRTIMGASGHIMAIGKK